MNRHSLGSTNQANREVAGVCTTCLELHKAVNNTYQIAHDVVFCELLNKSKVALEEAYPAAEGFGSNRIYE